MKNHFCQILIISLLCSLSSQAQQVNKKAKAKAKAEDNKEEISPAKLSIIAIGAKPPRRFGLSGGSTSAILPSRPGEIPPRRLYFHTIAQKNPAKNQKKEDIKVNPKSINVTFNNPSHFIEVPPNKTLKLRRRGRTQDNKLRDYMSISPLEPGSITMILLRPAGKGDKRWVSEPKQIKINLSSDAYENKKLILLNLSRRPVKSIFHQDEERIPAGGLQLHESILGLELHRIAAFYGREDKVIYNTALRLNKSRRLLCHVFYDSNPNTNDGRTVGLFRTSFDLGAAKVNERETK